MRTPPSGRRARSASFGSAKRDELLDALRDEWVRGVVRLNEFEHLFSTADHVEHLNLLGGAFFAEVQRILWDDLLLCVTRLTDSDPRSLTVYRLKDFCDDDELHRRVKRQAKAAKRAAEFAYGHRNKRIGHKDWAYTIGESDALPSTTLREIRGALDAVHAVLQTVYMELRNQQLEQPVLAEPGVHAFLGRTESLVDAVRCVEELLAGLSDQAPAWDEDVARDCIQRLGGTPSSKNVERIINLRFTARWLRFPP